MHRISARESVGDISRVALVAALGGALACAQLLDLPSNPELVSDAPPAPPEPELTEQGSTPFGPLDSVSDGAENGGVREGVGVEEHTDAAPQPGAPGPTAAEQGPSGVDAGARRPPFNPLVLIPELGCTAARVDVVMIVDNSGSMIATAGEAELALPAFALRLEQTNIDYRIILISRHRVADRDATSEASTSVCVAAPLGGLSACPAEQPALTSRFFQYSVKIDASNSLARVLEAAGDEDTFGLTSVGWLEWLRPDTRIEFVEVTDADTDVAPEAFVQQLAALAPDRFSATLTSPGFVFHAITGLAPSPDLGEIYPPDEPVEASICTRPEADNPDNAGEGYQALSRATGGLRQPICPVSALTERLTVVANAVATRSAIACQSK